MPHRPRRSIPLAAAALSLGFGGCGRSHLQDGSGPGGPPGTGSTSTGGAGSTSTGGSTGGVTFGGSTTGGMGGAGRVPNGSGEALAETTADYVTGYCNLLSRCYPDFFGDYFGNEATCVRYYDDAFGGYYTSLLDLARDPAACERGLIAVLDCYTERYQAGSCDDFYYGYCGELVYYYDYYGYYGYYGGYYYALDESCFCWYSTGADEACL